MDDHTIIDTNFQEVNTEKIVKYTIEQVAKKLNISSLKVNHLIFKLNKCSENNDFFEDTNTISQVDYEKLEIAQDLKNTGMDYNDIIDYFKNNSHGLINKETGNIKDNLNKIDSQVIAKNVTIEIVKRMDMLESTITNTIINNVNESFKEEAKKIAQLSLEAMEKTKNTMINGIDAMNNKVESLEKKLESKDKEIERLYSKDTERMRYKLDEKQKEIENLKKQLDKEKNKSIFDKILKRNNK